MKFSNPPKMIDIMTEHFENCLRDEFAKAVLTGALMNNNPHDIGQGMMLISRTPQQLAEYSYEIADAMLMERDKRNS